MVWHFVFYFTALTVVTLASAKAEVPKLLLISFDGFRYDYLDRDYMSNFRDFYKNGVKAAWVKSSYITKTFLNHYSIVTGLYPESNGITGNTIYDGNTKEWWNCTTGPNCEKWFRGEPIWVTNNRGNKPLTSRRITGSAFWFGSDVVLHNYIPEYRLSWAQDNHTTLRARFDRLLDWYENSTSAINLGLLYYEQPDGIGHAFGPDPDGQNMTSTLKGIDDDFGYFMGRLSKNRELNDQLNVIVVSDHGMAGINDYIDLTNCLPATERYIVVSNSPIVGLWPSAIINSKEFNATLSDIIANMSSGVNCSRITVYTDKNIPYHYRSSVSSRIPPIILEPPPGTMLVSGRHGAPQAGSHGWNSSWDKMRAMFMARGPAFKKGYTAQAFDNINIYAVLCHVLDLRPAPNNGSLDAVCDMLAKGCPVSTSLLTIVTEVVCILLASAAGIVFIVFACRARSCCHGDVANGSLDIEPRMDERQAMIPVLNFGEDEDSEF